MFRIRKVILSIVFAVGFVLPIFGGTNASAVSNDDIMKKWVFTQFYNCMKYQANNEIPTNQQDKNKLVADSVFEKSGSLVDLPSLYFDGLTVSNISCDNLLKGDKLVNLNKGVLDYAGMDKNLKWSDTNGARVFLNRLGYRFILDDNGYSFTINAILTRDNYPKTVVKSAPVLFTKEGSDYKITNGTYQNKYFKIVVSDDNGMKNFEIKPDDSFLGNNSPYDCDGECSVSFPVETGSDTLTKLKEELEEELDKKYIKLKLNIVSSIIDAFLFYSNFIQNQTYGFESETEQIVEISEEGVYKYGTYDAGDYGSPVLYDGESTRLQTVRDMFGMGLIGLSDVSTNLQFTPAETYVLYKYYLEKTIPNYVSTGIICNHPDADVSKLVPVWLKMKDGSIGTCYVNFGGDEWKEKEVNVQQVPSEGMPYIKKEQMSKIIAWLQDENNVNEANLKDVDGSYDGGANEQIDGGNAKEDTCYTGGAAGSLGWILCSVLDFIQNSTEYLYEEAVVPALTISPKLFSVSGQGDEADRGAVYVAWGVFQQFSNIVFIILLLVVIFSQLTGVGIDNYGIKKVLPKMIVGVILINISYYVCLVAIDLSNIIGIGVQNLFEEIGKGISLGSVEGQEVASGAMTAVQILAVFITVSTVWHNPALLLSLLVSAFGVLISVVFIFLILSARQAVLIVLTAVAPVAAACYILPNTKPVFNKWLKAGWTLLLVFPICGLMIGGGNFVSKLLLSLADGNIYSALIAMVTGVAPIFFIPSVLKWSLTAVGKVGGVLSGLGDTARRGVTGALNKDPHLQNLRKAGEDRANRMMLRRRAGGYVGADGKFHERGLRRRFAKTGLGRALGMDVRMGEARDNYIKSQIARNQIRAHVDSNFANQALQDAKTQLADAKMKAEVEVDLGPKPVLDRTAYMQRVQSARNAQAFKEFEDQFAGLSKDELGKIAKNSQTFDFNSDDLGAQQRVRALIRTMNSKGMENDVFDILDRNESIGEMTSVMEELANSKNKVMRAYGKGGEGVGYSDFMNGRKYRDKNGDITDQAFDVTTGRANTSVSMKHYVDEKGLSFLVDLDDKALAQINTHSSNENQIMSNEMIVEGLARINSQDAVNQLDDMANHRTNLQFSGEQLSQFNTSTIKRFASRAMSSRSTDALSMHNRLVAASSDIVKDQNLLNRLSPRNRDILSKATGVTGL